MSKETESMKKLIYAIAIAAAVSVAGCKSDSFFIIDNDRNASQQTSAFNDETYIWESWLFSTNRVNEVK